jgi:hypothetical protein
LEAASTTHVPFLYEPQESVLQVPQELLSYHVFRDVSSVDGEDSRK